jgi:hypothetical protein
MDYGVAGCDFADEGAHPRLRADLAGVDATLSLSGRSTRCIEPCVSDATVSDIRAYRRTPVLEFATIKARMIKELWIVGRGRAPLGRLLKLLDPAPQIVTAVYSERSAEA